MKLVGPFSFFILVALFPHLNIANPSFFFKISYDNEFILLFRNCDRSMGNYLVKSNKINALWPNIINPCDSIYCHPKKLKR